MPDIGGSTRLYAVLGDPVAQVQAPALLNPVFARLGLDAVLFPVHAPADRLGAVIGGLQRIGNLDGLLITVPHKIEACRYADELSPAAALVNSTNAMRREADGRWYGDNFDGAGFVAGLLSAGHDPRGKRIFLAGAGGAGTAIAAALLGAGASHLSVYDPDPDRVATLTGRLEGSAPGRTTGSAAPRLHDADVAVNATPLGLRPGDPLPFAPDRLPPGSVVADIVMRPRETELLRRAAELGLPVHHGIHMLGHQVALYQRFFRLEPGGATRAAIL
ncbi:shikimate dehydrogenase family protein [Streptomyces sp. cmx-18-6]|uniref:shikimate dehydrogenase family protein n=1 Tax=Streptomyces sp. cmx-18-6 TaxID=2790930 RepID=UPI00397EDF99